MRVGDIPLVAALAAEEPAAPHWPVGEYQRMLEVITQTPTRRGAWVLVAGTRAEAQESTGAGPRAETLRAAENLQGFAMASHVAGICDLEAVVVGRQSRGKRLGAALVEAAAAWGRELGASRMELEVRASNRAALRLYGRMNFSIDGTRPGYYRNPEEDAVLMSLPLLAGPGKIA